VGIVSGIPNRVKLFVGMLSVAEELFTETEKKLVLHFGEIDFGSKPIPFTYTDYYEKEMGKGLLRRFVSFAELVDAGSLAEIKILTRRIEGQFSGTSGNRRINIDPGYVSGAKAVLATTKDYDHRIYLGEGIYAEVTLHYRGGSFRAWDWTYPDYRTQKYIEIFNKIRRLYMDQAGGGKKADR
jgi:hypothetical protein